MRVEIRTLPANISQWETVLELLESHLESSEASEKTKYEIYVSAEEIFTNIASYAYRAYDSACEASDHPPGNMAEVSCGFSDERKRKFWISFRDWGIPYNPLARPDPDFNIPLEQRRVGGLGIYMVKRFMDDTQYRWEDGCNILTIVKNL